MKKGSLIIFFLLMAFQSVIIAQDDYTEALDLYKYGKYNEALKILFETAESVDSKALTGMCLLRLISKEDLSVPRRNELFESYNRIYKEYRDCGASSVLESELKETMENTIIILQNSGVVMYHSEKLESAFNKMLTAYNLDNLLDNQDTTLMYTLAQLSVKRNDASNMVKFSEMCLERGMKKEDLYFNLISFYKDQKNDEKLLELLKRACVDFPDNEAFLIAEVNYYIKINEPFRAIERIEKMGSQLDSDLEFVFLMASLYENTGDFAKAVEIYQNILRRDRNNIQALYKLGSLNLEQGIINERIKDVSQEYFGEATFYLERAHKLEQKNREVLQSLCQLYSVTGEFEKYKVVKQQLDQLGN